MSTVRLVTRILPRDAPREEVSRLLTPEQVDDPVRTTGTASCAALSAETTYCRAVAVPPDCPDTDAAAAARCEGIAGLACLKKSRLRLVTEEGGGEPPALRVVPEVNAEGVCTGMLLSIPLRIPRSEVDPFQGEVETHQNGQMTLPVAGAGDGSSFVFSGTYPNQNYSTSLSEANGEHIQTLHSAAGFPFGGTHLEPNRNLPTTFPLTGAEDGSGFAFGGTHPNRNLQTNISVFNGEHVQTPSAAGTWNFPFNGTQQEPNQNFPTDVANGEWHRAERNTPVPCNGHSDPIQHHKKYKNTCDQCGERFPGKKKLVLHVKRVHEGVRCPFCDARFESGKRLKGHMSSEHAVELPHVCDVCSARFRTAETLKNHSTQHRRRFRCEECGKGFGSKGLLKGHRSSVHGHS